MSDVADWLSRGWVQALLALLLFTASIVTTFVVAKRERSRMELSFIGSSQDLVEPKRVGLGPVLEIRFADEPVSRVSKTAFAFWNSGTATILGTQITNTDPLRMEIPEGERVLQAFISGRTRAVIAPQVLVSDDRRSVNIQFEYLDRSDAVVVDIIHTAATKSVRVAGTLRGLPAGLRHFLKPRRWTNLMLRRGEFAMLPPLVAGLLLWISPSRMHIGFAILGVIVGYMFAAAIVPFWLIWGSTNSGSGVKAVPKVVKDNPLIATSISMWKLP